MTRERAQFQRGMQSRITREKRAADQRAVQEWHQRFAQSALTGLSVSMRAILDVLQDPAMLARLAEQAKHSTVDGVCEAGRDRDAEPDEWLILWLL